MGGLNLCPMARLPLNNKVGILDRSITRISVFGFSRFKPVCLATKLARKFKCGSRGGGGGGGGGGAGGPDLPPPPGKSHVIWISIGNMQLDPPLLEKLDPLWKMLDPIRNLVK